MLRNASPAPSPSTFESSLKCALFDRRPHHERTSEDIHEPANRSQEEDRSPRVKPPKGAKPISPQVSYGPTPTYVVGRRARTHTPRDNNPSPKPRKKSPPRENHEGYVSERRKRHLHQVTQMKAAAFLHGKGGEDQTRYSHLWTLLDEDEEDLMTMMRERTMPIKMTYDQKQHVKFRAQFIREQWEREAEVEQRHKERDEEASRRERALKIREEARAAKEARLGEQAKEERARLLRRLSQMVFKALCTDPDTGDTVDPKDLFRKLDKDKSGSVDREEFSHGLSMVRCHLEPDELDLVWAALDEDDGESDGEVDYNVLVAKLQRANEEAIRTSKPQVKAVLRKHTDAAMHAVSLKVAQDLRRQAGRTLPLGPHPMMQAMKSVTVVGGAGVPRRMWLEAAPSSLQLLSELGSEPL